MKRISMALAAMTMLVFCAALVGCNDETVPDPEIVKQRDAQRGAMAPDAQKGAGGAGNTQPGR